MCWTACYCGWVLAINIDMQHDKLESYIFWTCACAWWLTFIYMFVRWSTVCHSWPWLSCISPRQIQSNSSLWSLFVFNSPPCRPLCSILIYSFVTVECPQCFTIVYGWSHCLSAGHIHYVSCFVLNTLHYRFLYRQHKFFYCNFFNTTKYIARLLFLPKNITSPLATSQQICRPLALHGRPG